MLLDMWATIGTQLKRTQKRKDFLKLRLLELEDITMLRRLRSFISIDKSAVFMDETTRKKGWYKMPYDVEGTFFPNDPGKDHICESIFMIMRKRADNYVNSPTYGEFTLPQSLLREKLPFIPGSTLRNYVNLIIKKQNIEILKSHTNDSAIVYRLNPELHPAKTCQTVNIVEEIPCQNGTSCLLEGVFAPTSCTHQLLPPESYKSLEIQHENPCKNGCVAPTSCTHQLHPSIDINYKREKYKYMCIPFSSPKKPKRAKKSKDENYAIDTQQLIEVGTYWNDKMINNPPVIISTLQKSQERQKLFSKMIKDRDVDYIKEAIDGLAINDFHTGQKDPNWKATFSWFLKYQKIDDLVEEIRHKKATRIVRESQKHLSERI